MLTWKAFRLVSIYISDNFTIPSSYKYLPSTQLNRVHYKSILTNPSEVRKISHITYMREKKKHTDRCK